MPLSLRPSFSSFCCNAAIKPRKMLPAPKWTQMGCSLVAAVMASWSNWGSVTLTACQPALSCRDAAFIFMARSLLVLQIFGRLPAGRGLPLSKGPARRKSVPKPLSHKPGRTFPRPIDTSIPIYFCNGNRQDCRIPCKNCPVVLYNMYRTSGAPRRKRKGMQTQWAAFIRTLPRAST